MSRVEIKEPAFGCICPRFSNRGIHPKLRSFPPEVTTVDRFELPYVDQPQTTPEVRQKGGRAIGGWDRQLKVEAEATLPQVLLKHTKWKERKERGRNLGPGSHNIKDFLELNKLKPSSFRGICSALDKPRIKYTHTAMPGPGAYGDLCSPAPASRIATRPPAKCAFMSTLFGRDLPNVGGDIGPGAYEIRGEVDKLLQKPGGARGPYDLFTRARDDSTLCSYQQQPRTTSYEPGQYDASPSFVEALKKKEHNGKFSAAAAAKRPPDPTPGPADYCPAFLSKPQPSKRAPFDSSTVRKAGVSALNPVTAFVHFYDIDKGYTIKHFGNTSSFKSEGRNTSVDREKMLRERMK